MELQFAHPLLRAATPEAWVAQALPRFRSFCFIDHADWLEEGGFHALFADVAYAVGSGLDSTRCRGLRAKSLRHYASQFGPGVLTRRPEN